MAAAAAYPPLPGFVYHPLPDALPDAADLRAAGHPWEHGYGTTGRGLARLPGAASHWMPDMPLDWVPMRPELVCEVAYDHLEGVRFRHPARFKRWRPDRDARSCTVEQLR